MYGMYLFINISIIIFYFFRQDSSRSSDIFVNRQLFLVGHLMTIENEGSSSITSSGKS